MFADDCIIYCTATKRAEMKYKKKKLDHCCIVSSQFVNYHKSKIELSNGVLNTDKKGDIAYSSNLFD